jgi:hypothetical protein
MVIYPYKYQGIWVFDDEKVGLRQEPFIAGADKIIDRFVKTIPNAESGFSLIFSASPFPSYQVSFDWLREEYEGNWYYNKDLDMEGWLCPALFKYFAEVPKKLYVHFKKINEIKA